MNKKFYITTPIYFPSAKLHIGHAYSTVACDAIARFKRLLGYDVMFLTGTDEHGQKIERNALEANMSPKEYVDEIVLTIKDLWKLFNISNDKFIRTTDKFHEQCVQKIFEKLYKKGDIYKSTYEGWYCTPCESFWTELQLADGKCPDCKRSVEKTKEESYFFKLSNYTQRIIDHIEKNPDWILPQSRANEMLSNFLRPGLDDLAVSRTSFKWGIKVPFDDDHIIYVWIDALSNYITALNYLGDDQSEFYKYWPADVHVMAKEIIRFHTIIWPAMLMALDLPLPKQVFGHGWLVLEGGKMSKSKGNVVDPVILCNKYGTDAIRYFLLREIPFGQDGVFSNQALINRINSDLANDLGNLVSRTVSMALKYFGDTLPKEKSFEALDLTLKDLSGEVVSKVIAHMESFNSPLALSEIWRLVSRTNKYIDETMPWVLAKDAASKPRLCGVIYNLCESLRIISVLLLAFMPSTSQKIFDQLGVNDELKTLESIKQFGARGDCFTIKKGEVLFPRIDVKKDLESLTNLE